MENWRTKANNIFPEYTNSLNRNLGGPSALWDDLYLALEKAYEARPINEDLISRIYDYAGWCFSQSHTGNLETDLPNAAAVGFIENLPLNKNVSDDLYRWLSKDTFQGCETLFRHHLSDEEYYQFRENYTQEIRDYPGP